jgi:hypothetical protein
MTKLQIVELNRKDQRDAFALLDGAEVADADRAADGSDAINAARIASLTSQAWGLQRTFDLNLARRASNPRPQMRHGIEALFSQFVAVSWPLPPTQDVEAAHPVELIVAAAAEQGVRAVVAGEDVVARRALDLLGAGGDVAIVAVADPGLEDLAADRRVDGDPAGVVDPGEGGAVVRAGAAVEDVAVAGLAARR